MARLKTLASSAHIFLAAGTRVQGGKFLRISHPCDSLLPDRGAVPHGVGRCGFPIARLAGTLLANRCGLVKG